MAHQQIRPSWLQRRLQVIPASRPGSWIFAHMLHYIDRPLLRWTHGRVSIPSLFIGTPMIMLTTIGAKSGKPRTLPLIGIVDGDDVIMVASNWGRLYHPAW